MGDAGRDRLDPRFFEPADNVEYFLAELFASQRRGGGARPSPMDAAFLAWRYRSEFGMAEIPRVVQRVLFPLVVAAGGLAGRWTRYADAVFKALRTA